MNFIEMIGTIAAGVITIAIVAVIVQPNSTAPSLLKNSGDAFSATIKAATLKS